MKEIGIVRKLDELGRIVIPKDLRKKLNLREGDLLEMNFENGKIVLEKFKDSSVADIVADLWGCVSDRPDIDKISPLLQALEQALKEEN